MNPKNTSEDFNKNKILTKKSILKKAFQRLFTYPKNRQEGKYGIGCISGGEVKDNAKIAGSIEENIIDRSQQIVNEIKIDNSLAIESTTKFSLKNESEEVYIEASDIKALEICFQYLEKRYNSSIEIEDIEKGSIKFILNSSEEGLKRILESFESGELAPLLKKHFNIELENVFWIDSDQLTKYEKARSQKLLVFTIAGNTNQISINNLKTKLIKTSDANQRKTSQNSEENAILQKLIAAEALIYLKLVDLLGDDAKEAVKIIRQHAIISATCGVGAFFPGAGLLSFAANNWTMYARINSALGISLSKNALKSIATAIATNVISIIPGVAFTSVGGSVLKAFPGFGTIGGMAITSTTYYALSTVMGWIYLKGITTLVSSNKTINDENIKTATKKASQDKDFVRSIFNKAKSNYVSDYNEENKNTNSEEKNNPEAL